MKSFLSVVILMFSAIVWGQTGTIEGVLSDKEVNNEPLPFANVVIKGTTKGATTDFDGKYIIENIPVGTYDVEFSFVGYEPVTVPGVKVEANKFTNVSTALGASAAALDEVIIQVQTSRERESALLLDQKKSIEIKQSIGAEELTRKAVTNVQQGLSKVSGITNVQNRGVFVRGLDDRYNFLLMNGLPIASSDPDNKIIPLNYIATNIVSHVDVFKTFDGALYQDFAGATFQINTKSVPKKPETVVSFGAGLNTNTTFKDFSTDDSGSSEYFGYTGSGRNLPGVFGKNVGRGYTATSAESADLFNTSWTPERSTAPLSTRFGISHGQGLVDTDKHQLAFYFSLNFRNDYQINEGVERALNSEGTAQQDFSTTNYEYSTQKSGILSLDYDYGDNLNLKFNTIYLQNTSNFIREAQGLNDGFTQLNNEDFYIRDIKYTQNDLISFQLLGDYSWNDKKHEISFASSLGLGKNNIPDRRVLRAAGSGEDAEYITTNGINPFKFYQELENTNINGKVEYKLGLNYDDAEGRYLSHLRVGYNVDLIEYDFFNRIINVGERSSSTQPLPNLDTNDPQSFFETGFAEGYLFYTNTADPAATSTINQYVNGFYLDYSKEWDKLFVNVGVRGEYAFREILYREPLNSINDEFLSLQYDPIFASPWFNVKYTLNDKTNLRVAGSQTVTRPRLREILPTVYQDGDGNQVIGNPDLENSKNYNLDFKYEYFLSSSELLSATVFGKYIKDPIERLAEATSVGYRTKFGNFDEATIYGIELEARLSLGERFDNESFDPFSLGVNAIIMSSNATAEEGNPEFAAVTNLDRKLQGASDWGINADFEYKFLDSDKVNSSVNFIFNTYGKRIYAVGVEGADEIYEKPINQLDISWNTSFNDKIGVQLRALNILNEKTLFTQDPTATVRFPERFSNVIEQFNQGVNFSATVSYKF